MFQPSEKIPIPILAQLRQQTPVAWVPQLNSVLLVRRDDIVRCEKDVATFSSEQPEGLMNRLMGRNMMRKDGREHTQERKILLAGYSSQSIREHWQQRFSAHAQRLIEQLEVQADQGNNVDLVQDFAMPLSAMALATLTGLEDCQPEQLDNWSQAMIDGISNFAGDPDTEAACRQATASVDAEIDRILDGLGAESRPAATTAATQPNMLRLMFEAGLDREKIQANIKLAISGGQNEPRDAIAGCIWSVLTHADVKNALAQEHLSWHQVVEEYLRWESPIGMSPRRLAQPCTLHGCELPVESRVFLMFSSANRDANWFAEPEKFDPWRDSSRHIAFGAGPHFCIGAATSRALITDIALPMLFNRFPAMELAAPETVRFQGWAFRGLPRLPVRLQ